MEFLRFLSGKQGELAMKQVVVVIALTVITLEAAMAGTITEAVANDSSGLSMPGVCAYIDPGSGSIILQVIIAGLVGTLFVLKFYFRQVVNFFKNLFSRKSDSGKS
jgi:hypothetical protein